MHNDKQKGAHNNVKNILLSRGILQDPDLLQYFKPLIKSTDQVTIVAFSHFPKYTPDEQAYNAYYEKGGEYYEKMISSFEPYGIKPSQISWVHYFKDTKASAKKKIHEADIIYFPGGAPDLFMKRIEAFEIKEDLESHQGLFIGSSAGAMIQFKDYHISPDVDYPYFTYEHGLNLLDDFSVEVHYRRRKKQKAALRKVHRAYRHPIYAIPDDGAIIVDGKNIMTLKSAVQLYDKKGIIRK